MAETYSSLPSQLLGLESDSFAAWCINEAAFTWGKFVEAELDTAAEKGTDTNSRMMYRRMRMAELMNEEEMEVNEENDEMAEVTPIQRAPRRFADPAEFVNRGGDV